MNRLSTLPAPPLSSAPVVAAVERPTLRSLVRQDSAHSLLGPLHYEPNYAYPLVVWLHGPGGDDREVRQVMPLVSARNYVWLAVRGAEVASLGYGWPQSPEAISGAECRIADAVKQAQQRFNVHSDRIFLAGYSSGGTMALRIALRNPGHFAGAASLGGPFPEGCSPLSRLSQARHLRLLIAHCRDSLTYPVDRVCQELSLFHAAGMSVTLRQYPCDDELTTQMLHDVDIWLMEQVTGVAADDEQTAFLPSDWN
jgi:phospholipase/carboxylesterase